MKTIETGMKRSIAMLAMMTLGMMLMTEAQAADAFKPAQFQQQNVGHVFTKNSAKKPVYHYVAKTSKRARKQGKVNASGIIWNCKKKRCTISGPWPKPSVTACQKLARFVGPIRSYGRTGHYLSVNYMRQCNQRFVRKNSKKITGVASQAKGNRSGLGNQAVSGSVPQSRNSATSQAANRARGIGEAEARAKQARELQRMHDLGSPTDKVHGGPGASGTQDCSHSPNRAQCLQDNMNNPGQKPGSPNRDEQRSMMACLQAGGNLTTCRQQGNNKPGLGHLTEAPTAPGAQQIPGRGQAQSGATTTEERDRHGVVVHRTTVHNDDQGRVTSTDETVRIRTRRNEYAEYHYHTDAHGHETSSPVRTYHVIPRRNRHRGHSSQPAPEGSSMPADNCNWNPAMKKCVKPRHTGKGMTSQPGPNGQNPGAKPARTSIAPNIGVAGAINCGDAGSEACNRAGSGFSSGGRRLDHKDPGPAFGGPGTP